jgi:hypothetical protein
MVGLLLAMACHGTLEDIFLFDCAGHRQIPFRLTKLLDFDCRIFPYYVHILSIFVEKKIA